MSEMTTAQKRARRVATTGAEPTRGDRVIANYCWDMALCRCPPSHTYSGVPCVTVTTATPRGRLRVVGVRVRHAACGRSWTVPARRRADRASGGVR